MAEPPARSAPRSGPLARLDLKPVLGTYDSLMQSGRQKEAGQTLRAALSRARETGDRRAELTLWSELMGFFRQTGEEARALQAVEKGTALIGELKIAGSVGAGTILINAATALAAFGRTREALRCFEESLRCYRRQLRPDDPRWADLMNNMASAHQAAGEYRRAEALLRRALVLLAGGRRMDEAVTRVNLAQLYGLEAPDDLRAGQELALAFDCFEDPSVTWDGSYAHSCRKCAPAFAALGREDLAAELLEREKLILEGA